MSRVSLCLVVSLLVLNVQHFHTGVVEGGALHRTTTEADLHHLTHNVNVGPINRTHRPGEKVTLEIGPMVWNHEKRTWVQITEPTTTPHTTAAPDKTNIIVAPDLKCDEGEMLDASGMCREDWGRMADSPRNPTQSPVVTNPPGHICPQGQVLDLQGHCRDQRGRIVPEIEERPHRVQPCPRGQSADDQGRCRDQRGRTVETSREDRTAAVGRNRMISQQQLPGCPDGQVVDYHGQCREDWGRRRLRSVRTEEWQLLSRSQHAILRP